MNPNKFKKEIKNIIPLVFTYGAAFYKLKQFSDLNKIDKVGFIRKCNEGFKMAQEKILYNILEIEEEEKIIKNDIKLMKKGKHDDLLKDEAYQKLLKKYDILKIQIFSFRNLADALAWTIMGMDRT